MPELPVTDAWFDAAICRNCGSDRTTPYCAACGQKAAQRYDLRDLGKEAWERLRLFEMRAPRTLARLTARPGTVARDHVMGRRASYTHPLTLLVTLVALLVLLLAANRYFGHYAFTGRNSDVDRMGQRVIAYANWSFSIGIVAIFATSWTIFRRRLGYNAVEHAVLAVYLQALILALIILNLLPTLIWRDPGFILAHKTASQYYIPALKVVLVAIAFRQFFCSTCAETGRDCSSPARFLHCSAGFCSAPMPPRSCGWSQIRTEGERSCLSPRASCLRLPPPAPC